MGKDFEETEASTVDVSVLDEKPLNAGELLNTVFSVFEVRTGSSVKTDPRTGQEYTRNWGMMKVYAEELYCVLSYKPDGTPVYAPKQCWMSPHMILQATRWSAKDYPVRCGLMLGENNAYVFCAPSKVVKREESGDAMKSSEVPF